MTTVALADREVEVYYPADAGAVLGREKASYASFEVLPEAIVAILPPALNLVIPLDAYQDVRVSGGQKFPLFIFSHGAGGFRHAYSGFMTLLASHGLIAVSIDHLEWGLLAQVGLRSADDVDRTAEDVLLETISRLGEEGGAASSVLSGGVDVTRIVTAGHSAGGRAAFALPGRPEIKAMIGYATGSAGGLQTDKSILLFVGSEDGGATRLEEAYEALSPIKRFVSVDAAGHNSFTDQCAIIHGGNNFLDALVESGFPIPENLLALAIDGCLPENLEPATFWNVMTHFTVATVRAAFGIDAEPVGLGDGVAEAFPGVTLTYRHEL
ncbi:MAG: hypothetical protein P8R42_25085 [Candidatus Binatia bacterium]|nr:hypothetical protein [Candidatus Binatia bacterium]